MPKSDHLENEPAVQQHVHRLNALAQVGFSPETYRMALAALL